MEASGFLSWNDFHSGFFFQKWKDEIQTQISEKAFLNLCDCISVGWTVMVEWKVVAHEFTALWLWFSVLLSGPYFPSPHDESAASTHLWQISESLEKYALIFQCYVPQCLW